MKIFNKISKVLSIISMGMFFFLPISALAAGPAPVDLLSASNFIILSQTGITNTGSHTSVITGNIGASPITATAMNTVFCSEMIGTIYGVNAGYVGSGSQVCFAGNPPLANKTLVDNAVLDMGIAYNDATGRTLPTATELGAGNIGGMTLAPGLYKWSTDVSIPTNLTLSGNANDVWIFQIAGNLDVASAGSVPASIKVILDGGAQASNIFWQVSGTTGATLGTYSTFNGNILSAKQIIIQTGAILNGRAFAQTQVTLDANIISPGLITNNGSTISGTLGGSVGGSTVGGTLGGTTGGGSTGGTIGGAVGGNDNGGNGGSNSGGSSRRNSSGSVLGANTNNGSVLGASISPGFPKTGFPPKTSTTPWNIYFLLIGIPILSLISYRGLKKN